MSDRSNYHDGTKGSDCYFCGAFGEIEEHHIIPQRFDGPDKQDNIVSLCTPCHKKLEALYDTAFYEWFGIDDKKGKRQFHHQCPRQGCKNTVTQKWRNTVHHVEIYACDQHVRDSWVAKEKFELVEEADE